jgi:hypothetical protein
MASMDLVPVLIWLFGIGGVAPLVYAAWLWRRDRERARRWVPVNAVVVRNVVVPDSDGPIVYPVLAFKTLRGESVEVRSRCGSGKPTEAVGYSVSAYYDPKDPQQAEIIGAANMQIAMLVALGLLSLGMSLPLILLLRG